MSEAERLYHLLPAIYRQRDLAVGQPLRALLTVVEQEFDRLEADVGQSYENWFIETCQAWVIPYLADLVGIQDLATAQPPLFGQRRRVANHIAYQRRKGVATVLSHVAQDVTGWPAFVTEASQRIAYTQTMKNVRPQRGQTIDVRDKKALAFLGTAFDRSARTVDVRPIDPPSGSRTQPGLASLNALALYFWRLQSFPLRYVEASRVERGANLFTFDPLKRPLKLFVQPESANDLSTVLQPHHFPQPLTRAMLSADLARVDAGQTPRYYGPQQDLAIWADGRFLRPSEILCGTIRQGQITEWLDWLTEEEKQGVIDPENGRFLLADSSVENVIVNYTYGASGQLGSGPFRREFPRSISEDDLFYIQISRAAKPFSFEESYDDSTQFFAAESEVMVASLGEAIRLWDNYRDYCAKKSGNYSPRTVIRFLDCGTYHEPDGLEITLSHGSHLQIEAASGVRPTIDATHITFSAEAGRMGLLEEDVDTTVVYDRHVLLRGLLIQGEVNIEKIAAGKLNLGLEHCTLQAPLTIAKDVATVVISAKISDSLLHDLVYNHERGELMVQDSAITGTIGAQAEWVTIQRCTVLGNASLTIANIVDAIFLQDVAAHEASTMRYSYAHKTNLTSDLLYTGRQKRPIFTSLEPTHPGFGQLSAACPAEIRYGASNGQEIGVFNQLHRFQRESNLARIENEYLPLGQALGTFFVT